MTCGSVSARAPAGPASSRMVPSISPKPYTARVRVEAQPVRGAVDGVQTDPAQQQVGGGVVADGHHQERRVAQRQPDRIQHGRQPRGPRGASAGGHSTCSVRSSTPAAASSCNVTSTHTLWTLAVHTGWCPGLDLCAGVDVDGVQPPGDPGVGEGGLEASGHDVGHSQNSDAGRRCSGRAGASSGRPPWCAGRGWPRPRGRRLRRRRAPWARPRSAARPAAAPASGRQTRSPSAGRGELGVAGAQGDGPGRQHQAAYEAGALAVAYGGGRVAAPRAGGEQVVVDRGGAGAREEDQVVAGEGGERHLVEPCLGGPARQQHAEVAAQDRAQLQAGDVAGVVDEADVQLVRGEGGELLGRGQPVQLQFEARVPAPEVRQERGRRSHRRCRVTGRRAAGRSRRPGFGARRPGRTRSGRAAHGPRRAAACPPR